MIRRHRDRLELALQIALFPLMLVVVGLTLVGLIAAVLVDWARGRPAPRDLPPRAQVTGNYYRRP